MFICKYTFITIYLLAKIIYVCYNKYTMLKEQGKSIVTFFGHANFQETAELYERLALLLRAYDNTPVDFYLGGYGKFDSFAFRQCKAYQKKNPQARLIYVTPYLGKTLDSRRGYLEKNYNEILYPPIEHVPPKFAICKRNEWMIEQADIVIAYVDCHFGGAYKALLHAKRKKVVYVNLYSEAYILY